MLNRLKHAKESLMCCIEGQLCHLDTVDAKELGEVVDMVKDLEEAIYYCTITEAMNEGGKHKAKEHEDDDDERYYPMNYNYRDMDRMNGRMYYHDPSMMYAMDNRGGKRNFEDYNMMYARNSDGRSNYGGENGSSTGSSSSNGSGSNSANFTEYMLGMRDPKEGRSYASRRNYMESKEMRHDKAKQMKELERYMQELTQDMVEMIEGSSPEEK